MRTCRLIEGIAGLLLAGSLLFAGDDEEQPGGAEALRVDDATAVLVAGEVVRGDLELTETTLGKRRGQRYREVSARGNVLLLEDAEGRIVWFATEAGAGIVAGIERLVSAELAAEYVELAEDAVATRDVPLLRRLVKRARALGAEDSPLDKVEKKIEAYVRQKKKPVAKKVAAIEARAEALDAGEHAAFWRRVDAVRAAFPPGVQARLYEAMLQRQPRHPEATAGVRELVLAAFFADVPADKVGRICRNDADTHGWLECLAISAEMPLEIALPPDRNTGIDEEERRLGQLVSRWRPDLVCFRTENLRVMTPRVNPGSIARCLRMGELVSRTLNDVFSQGRAERPTSSRLTLYLYESKGEYRKKSVPAGVSGLGGKEWSAGHYSTKDNVQHIYLPSPRAEFDKVMATYAHELTHNWVMMKCPLFTFEQTLARRGPQTGFWIVEGIADFVEEFRWDLEAGLAEAWNDRGDSLDIVRNLDPESLLPWEFVFTATQEEFHALSPEPKHKVPISWKQGWSRNVSDLRLFYVQSAATCQYLYHGDDEGTREAFLHYVASYYTARTDELSPEAAFGCDAAELGRRVEAFARAKGPAPK